MRWFREWRRRRCIKAGHPMTVRRVWEFLEMPSKAFRAVADEVRVTHCGCQCGELGTTSEDREPLDGLRLPSEEMAELRRTGKLTLSGRPHTREIGNP